MTTRRISITAPAAALLALVVGVTAATMPFPAHAQHDHGHDAQATAGLVLNDGARWATDEPLRTGMQRIRNSAAPALAAEPGALSQKDAAALATAIREQVSYLVANCHLEPKADAVLHVLIAELLGGAGELERDPRSAGGLPRIAHALQQYPEYFDHPGWKPVPAPH
jgi:hypothetical protein